MDLALTLNPLVDTDLLYAQQLGVHWIIGDVPAWDRATLAAARNRVEKAGLVLCGLGSLPASLLEHALSGRAESEAALAEIGRIITDVGELGIASLAYKWPWADLGKGITSVTGRGGASSTVYTLQLSEDVPQPPTREALWQALVRLLQRIVPVAEAAGVHLVYKTDVSLACLPEDARILDSVGELDRLFQVAGSSCHGLDLDHGFVTHVLARKPGATFESVIEHLGRQGRIFAVRLHNLRSTEGGIQEHFLDEDRLSTLRALQAYQATQFKGPLCLAPAPDMSDDTEWRHKGYAFGIGYLRALLQATA